MANSLEFRCFIIVINYYFYNNILTRYSLLFLFTVLCFDVATTFSGT